MNFHAKDGSGYKFLGEMVVQLDRINPQVRFGEFPIMISLYYLMLLDYKFPLLLPSGGLSDGICLLKMEAL